MKKLVVVMMLLVMVFCVTACGNPLNDSADNISVSISIDYTDDSGVADVEDVAINVPEGATVLDVLNAYAEENDCAIIMEENSTTPYVISIGGLEATDTAGWTYEVNDEMVMDSADSCVVKNGADICWAFQSWI